ncbi:HNH endonuclease [Williamsia sp. SKLECPSW1]
MSAWILSVGKDYPQHLQFAIEDGLWDTTRNANIRAGDDLFFWLGLAGFRLWARATGDLRALTVDDAPARWADRERTVYLARVHLVLVSDELDSDPGWGEFKTATGIRFGPNIAPVQIPDRAESYLRSIFVRPEGSTTNPVARADISFSAPSYILGEDLRERARKEIVIRQGQPSFRTKLLRAYESTCAVTGCDVEAVLEAAHVDRYFGDHSHHVTNGLLLRSDVHTLFDAQLVTVDAEYRVRISPQLSDSGYGALEGQAIRLPKDRALWPDLDALRRHRDECLWVGK